MNRRIDIDYNGIYINDTDSSSENTDMCNLDSDNKVGRLDVDIVFDKITFLSVYPP